MLTSFEHQALECIAPLLGTSAEAFRKQLASTVVVSRENTGVGFYTRVSVDRDRSAPVVFERQDSPAHQPLPVSAHFNVDDIEHGLSVILWGDAEGFLMLIEGVTFGDNQLIDVDLNTLQFRGVAQLS